MENHSLNYILRKGIRLYLNKFREELEKNAWGQYVYIDVDKEQYIVNEDSRAALNEAKEQFGEKVFFSTRVGDIDELAVDARFNPYAWLF